jgi:hypothetical protein
VPPRNVRQLAEAIAEITKPDVLERMRAKSASVLQAWQREADPVEGVRKALQYFKVV